jgi:ABC-type nitrate/sulfonate/bicarbonate transport system substrate-binding protein
MTGARQYVLRGCLLIALLLGACTPFVMEQGPPETVTLKVLALPYLSYAPIFIAEEGGYFAEQGLEIEFIENLRSAEAVPALAQGELDVASPIITFGLLNAMARGARIRIVAGKGYLAPEGCAYGALVARRALVESGELHGPAQLQGRRIAMTTASFEDYLLEKLLNTAGLTLEDVEPEDIPAQVHLEALEKGTIDLAAMGEPWLTRALQAGHGVLWMPFEQVIPDFEYASIVYGPTLLDENPEAGRRFMIAYLKAVRQYNQGKTERNLEILAEHTGLDQEFLRQACWPAIRGSGQINVQSVLDFQAWAVEKGYLDSPVAKDQFWDPSFAEYANEVLGVSPQ